MDDPTLRRASTEAAERYPIKHPGVDTPASTARALERVNGRARQQQVSFRTGAGWVSEFLRQGRHYTSLAKFNAAACAQSMLRYPQGLANAPESLLISLRMAFQCGAAWARTHHLAAV